MLLTDGEVYGGSMAGPDAKRWSVAYVLISWPAAEVLLGKRKRKQRQTTYEIYHLVQQFYTCHTVYLLLKMRYIT